MFKTIISISLVVFICIKAESIFGQEERLRFIGAESGINFQFSKLLEHDFIRGDIPTYGFARGTNSVRTRYQNFHVGLNAEFRSKSNRFGLIGGLRFTQINSSFGKSINSIGTSDFFYLLYKEEGTTTEYLKIKDISQSSNYMGIPIEIRYLPYRAGFCRIYIKMAGEFNYRLNTKSDVVFYDLAMEHYKEDVVNKFDVPNNFFSRIYCSGGLNLGKNDKPTINLEGIIASLVISDKSSTLVKPLFGIGIQLNIQVPF